MTTPAEHMCPACSKGTYPTWTAAKQGARRQRRRTGMRLHPYRCPAQTGWHLTSEKTRRPQRRKENAA